MDRSPARPLVPEPVAGRLVVVEAAPGEERRARIRIGLAGSAAEILWLVCDKDREGLWSGLRQLLEVVIEDLETAAPDLLSAHESELAVVLPERRASSMVASLSLTDVAQPHERVRNYSVDRVFRVLHGLADLVAGWRETRGLRECVLVCDGFESAGSLVRRFFSNLLRRKGQSARLGLVLALSPGTADQVLRGFSADARHLRWQTRPEAPPEPAPEEAGRLAEQLEREVGEDTLRIEKSVARLIWYWERSATPERALKWKAVALGVYNHLGCYEDGIELAEPVLAHLDEICRPENMRGFWRMTRWNVLGNVYGCYNSVGQPEKALRAVEDHGIGRLDDACELARAHYVLAMSWARFLPTRDTDKAERHLAQGLSLLEQAPADREDVPFLESFLLNGLAYVRHRQGSPEEAITLCQRAHQNLTTHLRPGQHDLHRSVLCYNIAQVYAALQEADKAIEYYSAAIEMDPNYSEYYNERGSAFLETGRLADAEADYRRAIELSPPYFEVWANLGQCYSAAAQPAKAVEAYGTAIDLEPSHALAWLGRAQVFHGLGRFEQALADYDRALELEPADPLVLSNRAAVHWELGRPDQALADLDAAIALAPTNAVLLENRRFIEQNLPSRVPARAVAEG